DHRELANRLPRGGRLPPVRDRPAGLSGPERVAPAGPEREHGRPAEPRLGHHEPRCDGLPERRDGPQLPRRVGFLDPDPGRRGHPERGSLPARRHGEPEPDHAAVPPEHPLPLTRQTMRRLRQERGFALVSVLLLTALLMALALAHFSLTSNHLSSTRSTMNSARGLYAAEAGLNLRATEV